jgi:hypothetical protein
MDDTRNLLTASASAAIVAGPIFVILVALLSYQDDAGAVMHLDSAAIPGSLLLLLFSILFGALLAFPTCLLVGGVLGTIGAALPLLRSAALWLLVAGGIGFGVITGFGLDLGAETLAFIFTAIACAGIVRARLHWD